ncbi:MAG: phosphatase PAP2 family protein [Oscillospiraceae bacterium]|nr:phosphatase PAP2 family protein [Oscillospiraceae bacterium]
MSVLYWLESIRNPVLDFIMQLFTHLGSEVFFLVIALTVFWCFDKREGIYLLFVGFIGTVLNQFLKLVYRIPRPWVQDPKFTIVESARADAGGYSFPSGHTQNVVGTLGGIARWTKRKWLRIVCIVLLLLTSFSRMYLGVHTPLDVGVAFLIAVVLIFALYPVVRKTAENPKLMYVLLGVLITVAFAFVLYANLTDFSALGTDEEVLANINEGRKNSYSLFGAMLGFLIAYPLDQKYIQFKEKAVWWVQILKTVGGLAGVLAIKEGLKLLFNAVGFTWLGTNAIRYCVVVFFAAAVWPLVFPLLRRLSKEKETA